MQISDNGEWTKIIWEADINGKMELISSSYTQDNRFSFLRALNVDPSQLLSLKDKEFRGDIFTSSTDGSYKVSPSSLFEDTRLPSQAVTQQPFKALQAVPVKLPQKNIVAQPAAQPAAQANSQQTIDNAKSLAGRKGAVTKSLKIIEKNLASFIGKEELENIFNNKDIVEQMSKLRLCILQELNNRS